MGCIRTATLLLLGTFAWAAHAEDDEAMLWGMTRAEVVAASHGAVAPDENKIAPRWLPLPDNVLVGFQVIDGRDETVIHEFRRHRLVAIHRLFDCSADGTINALYDDLRARYGEATAGFFSSPSCVRFPNMIENTARLEWSSPPASEQTILQLWQTSDADTCVIETRGPL